jgi:hypothetical protein
MHALFMFGGLQAIANLAQKALTAATRTPATPHCHPLR